MILVAFTRPASAKSCRARAMPSEIEVWPSAVISSIPLLISDSLYDHPTRVVAFAAKDTTEKRAASSPRKYWFTSFLAKAFSPPGPSIEPSGRGFFIEPLSSSTKAKSIVAQGGLGGGSGGDGGREASDRTRPPADVAFFTSPSPEAADLIGPKSSGTCNVQRKRCVLHVAWRDGAMARWPAPVCGCVHVCARRRRKRHEQRHPLRRASKDADGIVRPRAA